MPSPAARSKKAFSLIEILLVMSIMATMAAIAVPMAMQAIATNRLQGSADRVQAVFASARCSAIRSGNQYAFYFKPNSRSFFAGKFNPLVPTPMPMMSDESKETDHYTDMRSDLLEYGVTFNSQDIGADSRSDAVGSSDVEGYERILFYPDGQVQPAKIFLAGEMEERLVVELRSLTGSSSVFDPAIKQRN